MHPEKFAKIVLILFKPFSDISELRPDEMTWTEALRLFEENASARILRYIENIQAVQRSVEAGIEFRKQRKAAMEKGEILYGGDAMQTIGINVNVDNDGVQEEDDIDMDLDEPVTAEQKIREEEFATTIELKFQPELAGLHLGVEEMKKSMQAVNAIPILKSETGQAMKDNVDDFITLANNEVAQKQIQKAFSEIKKLQKADIKAKENKMSTIPQSTNSSTQSHLPQARLIPLQQQSIITNLQQKLNLRQQLAFLNIADTFLAELANEGRLESQKVDVPQLKMFLAGSGIVFAYLFLVYFIFFFFCLV